MNRLSKVLTQEAIEQFDAKGYYVFPEGLSPFDDDEANDLLDELLNIHRKSLDCALPSKSSSPPRDDVMHPNKVEFLTAQGPLKLVKPNVFEFDLHAKSSPAAVPAFHRFFRESMPAVSALLKERIPTLSTLCTDPQKDMTLKLQTNTGGCFPWHYDNPSPPNKRLLTIAVYLTKDWSEAMGGEVQLLPFLGTPVTVPPSFHTVVMFRSDMILHRVLPLNGALHGPKSPRCCFTVWIDGSSTNKDEEVNLRAKNLQESFIPTMTVNPIQRSLSRAVYDDLYKQALSDCFDKCSALSSSVGVKGEKGAAVPEPVSKEAVISYRLHDAHTKPLLANPHVANFVHVLRLLRQY